MAGVSAWPAAQPPAHRGRGRGAVGSSSRSSENVLVTEQLGQTEPSALGTPEAAFALAEHVQLWRVPHVSPHMGRALTLECLSSTSVQRGKQDTREDQTAWGR